MSKSAQNEIREAVRDFHDLQSQIKAALPERSKSPQGLKAWQDACVAWHNHTSILATFWQKEYLSAVESGDPESVDLAISFVEVNPYYFRSGYMKDRLFRRLRRSKLSEDQRQRLLSAITEAIHSHQGDGWNHFIALAAAFADARFVEFVSKVTTGKDPKVARRAKLLLAGLGKNMSVDYRAHISPP